MMEANRVRVAKALLLGIASLGGPAVVAACGSSDVPPLVCDDGKAAPLGSQCPSDAASTHDGDDATAADSAAGDTGAVGTTVSDGAMQGDGTTAGEGATAGDAMAHGEAAHDGSTDGGSTDDGGADGGGDAPLGASADATTDGAICGAIMNQAPRVVETFFDASTPPPSTGGTIESGTYFLTSVSIYGGPPLCATLIVSHEVIVTAQTGTSGTSQGNVIFSVGADQFGWGAATISGTYTTSGSTVTFTSACKDGGVTQSSYTATSTTLTLVGSLVSQCGSAVEVLTKQ
jgi:hypothetical protein